jgi:hypothetical protein
LYKKITIFSGTSCIKKWRNVKDNFKKSLNKTKSGHAVGSRRKYIYARQLSFLQTAGAATETQSNFYNNEIKEEVTQPEEPEQPPPLASVLRKNANWI